MKSETTPLKIVIVGHVDHGKSTLVGRFLYETDSLEEGKYEAIKATCERRGVPFEWAFLMDALQAERNQNITIDTAQIWFESDKRPYTIIDAPGHKEFLKNMVTGAAQADAALLLIAADEGIQEQSRRHCHMLSMLGIEQVTVVVNKMDLVDYDQERFENIISEYTEFLNEIGIEPSSFIPISAREGDNVASKPAENMAWYDGPNVVQVLDAFETPKTLENRPLRFPIQDVYRFDERRILAGRVEAGTLNVGDELVFTPHGKTARVQTIERWSAPASDTAHAGESIGVTLDEQIFVERGHVASHAAEAPEETSRFRANVFWMGKQDLLANRPYKLKLATQEVECTIREVVRIIDGSTLEVVSEDRDNIERYDVAEVILETKRPIAVERHDQTPEVGRFVIVDEYDVAGGGIVLEPELHQENIFWHEGKVARKDRERLNGHRGACVWLTGLSGAGKSSIAVELESQLHRRGIHTYILDGDNVRHGLGADLGFSAADRDEHIRRVGEVSKLFVDAGTIVVSAFISPYQRVRDRVRESMEDGQFIEVHVDASVEACEERDPKGLYEKARAGEIDNFTGISAPYEAPENPEIVIDTVTDESAAKSAAKIVDFLEQGGYLTMMREAVVKPQTA
ncbi:adenylyl-sulfate kinase [Persicimonas caeni]|uniref:Adenylyl-sulfate kinase n=1 Tax=Persicimonas caeni TaxID=2292766 RepID=A0A4Y6PTX7_PERCE|nr:adenylyl-sulfate kinase [Persicimonas caeni]QDG51700.1 adenylyl-sulfate kinase [Persicimonas caeni]QED32921.1 adenylyl-sulfate kinase [Persicimonas caeni]